MTYDRSHKPCPKCGGETYQEAVDIGVGVIYGPLGCIECAWSEDPKYDLSGGRSPIREDGSVFDQFGGVWPAASTVAKAYRMADGKE